MITYNRQLTKQMLKDLGIFEICWDYTVDEWWIQSYTKVKDQEYLKHSHIPITIAVKRHPRGKDKYYKIVVIYHEGKYYTYQLGRLIYAWFFGEVPEGMSVDHIDNDPMNNRLENLQLLTPAQNLRKKAEDRKKQN